MEPWCLSGQKCHTINPGTRVQVRSEVISWSFPSSLSFPLISCHSLLSYHNKHKSPQNIFLKKVVSAHNQYKLTGIFCPVFLHCFCIILQLLSHWAMSQSVIRTKQHNSKRWTIGLEHRGNPRRQTLCLMNFRIHGWNSLVQCQYYWYAALPWEENSSCVIVTCCISDNFWQWGLKGLASSHMGNSSRYSTPHSPIKGVKINNR